MCRVLEGLKSDLAQRSEHRTVNRDTRPIPVLCYHNIFILPEFDLTPGVKEGIRNVKEEFSKRADSILLNYIEYRKFGKNFLKKQRLSPDGMMQLAIQVKG